MILKFKIFFWLFVSFYLRAALAIERLFELFFVQRSGAKKASGKARPLAERQNNLGFTN